MARSFLPTAAPLRALPFHVSHPFAAGFRPAAAALAVALAFAVPGAPAQPVPAAVIHGGATFATSGSNLTVTTTNGTGTNHSAINWTSFSVPAGSVTQFVQPSATSTSINRVIAANPSQILGQLSSNGKLVLVNPWGITVGAGARVDTAGFTASTLAMSDADAIAGRLYFSGGTAPLQVDGAIRAQGGDIVLIAPQIATGASSLVQSDGAVVLAAGQQVEITGRGLEGIVMQVQAGTEAVNLGTLQGDAVGLFAGTLRHSGAIQAQGVTVQGGKVILQAASGIALAGDVSATDMYGGSGTLHLSTADGKIEQTAGALTGSLLAWGFNGDVLLDQPNHVVALAGFSGDSGQFLFRNADTLTIGSVGLGPDTYSNGVNDASSKLGATTIHTDAGGMYVHGPVGGGSVTLQAAGTFDMMADTAIAARAGKLSVQAGDAIMLAMQPGANVYQTASLYGATGVDLVAGGAIRSSSSWPAFGDMPASTSAASLYAGGGSGVTITANGNVELGSFTSVSAWRAPVAITSTTGSILGDVNVWTNGTSNGSITLSAPNGSVSFGSLSSSGSYSAPQAGAVTITANGDVQGFSIWAEGAYHASSANADGGAVSVTSNGGNISLTRISTDGGPGADGGGPGGKGGDIALTALGTLPGSGNITVTANLSAIGGSTEYGDQLTGGAGGHIALLASREIALSEAEGWSSIDASGGVGAGVPGGAGGSVLLTTMGGSIVQLGRVEVDANGGDGSVPTGDAISGKGGAIRISAPAGRVELESLHATGGSDRSWDGMNGAAGGSVDVQASGYIHLTHTYEGVTVDGGGAQDGAGAPGGTVTIVSTGSSIMLEGGIGARGGSVSMPNFAAAAIAPTTPASGGPDGGTVTLHADSTADGVGRIAILGGVTLTGGTSTSGHAGNGGTFILTADKDVVLSTIDVSGGAAYQGAVQGGSGGSVDVTSATGSIVVVQADNLGNVLGSADVQAYGGDGWSGAAGGDGGSLRFVAQGASGSVVLTGQANAAGGGGYAGGGLGGSVELRAGDGITVLSDITVTGGYDYNYRGRDGLGGSLVAVTTNGDVYLEGVDSDGLAGGAVTITSGGNIDAGWIYADGRYGYGVASGKGGDVTLQALSTREGAGNIVLRGDIDSQGGGSSVQPGNGGTVSVSAYRNVSLRDIYAAGGDHSYDANTDSTGGTVLIDSQVGDISASYIDTRGPQGGPVTMTAHQGNIALWGIDSSGTESAGGLGAGTITLEAPGTAAGRGSITVMDYLDAYGSSSETGDGGQGGTVLVHADKNISIGAVYAEGGSGNGSTAKSGAGGTIELTSDNGNIDVAIVSANGAYGDSVQGGAGGVIWLKALGTGTDAGTIAVSDELKADGGESWSAAGGHGGSIHVLAGSTVQLWDASAHGGDTYASIGSAGGGAGGSLELRSGGSIAVESDISLMAGSRYYTETGVVDGVGGTLVATTVNGDLSLGNVDTGGAAGGAVTLASGGNLDVGWIHANARYGYGQAGGNGGNITLQALSTGEGAGNIWHGGIQSEGAGSQVQPGNGGAVTISAYRDIGGSDIDVRGGYHSYDANTDGIGGTVAIDSQVGDISLGYVSTFGPQGGPVTIRAHQGNIAVSSINTSGSYSAGGLAGGAITLEAIGTAAGRGNISVGYLSAYGSSSGTGDGGAGGTVLVHADKNISIGTAYAGGGSSYASTGKAGDGGTIDVVSENGNIAADVLSANGGYGSSVGAGTGGAIRLKALGTATDAGSIDVSEGLQAIGGYTWDAAGGAGGSIRVEASRTVQVWRAMARGSDTYASIGSAAGGAGGSVFLSSLTGDVSVGGDVQVGGGWGMSGGNGGSLEVHAAGAVYLGGINAEGGHAMAAPGAGGNAGNVRVQAGSDVNFGDYGFSVRGGDGNDGAGGNGGSFSVSSGGSVTLASSLSASGGGGTIGGTGGSVDLQAAGDLHLAEIDASGGTAASSAGGAQGGHGGSVALRFGGTLDSGPVAADGEAGETGNSTHPDGGAGGAGGSIAVTFTGAGTFTLQGQSFTAAGGAGGDADATGAPGTIRLGGAGGNGGTISVSSQNGALVLAMNPETSEVSSLLAGAGLGGWNTDGTYAARGLPGQVNLAAATDLSVQAMTTDMLAGLSLQAGGALALDVPIVTDGGSVSLQAKSLTLTQPIDTRGSGRAFAAAVGPRVAVASTAPTGADVLIVTDTLNLQTTVNAGSAQAIVHPLTSTRATRLGGLDDGTTLYVSQGEIDLISAGTLVFGDALNTGGVGVGAPISVDPSLVGGLKLVSLGAITQDPGATLTAPMLDVQGGSATLGAISAIGPVTVRSTRTLQLQDAITSNAMGDAVVLVAPHLQAASAATIVTPSGRWLAYLDTHEGNDFGNLRSNNYALWGHTFAANPPGTVTDSGNRYLFAYQPALDVTADAVTKVYDATPAFTLTYHTTGFVDASLYQNAFLQDAAVAFTGGLAIANPGKNVGSYAITQGTLASNYAIRSFTGNTATITPAPLTIGGLAANDKVYDGSTAATTSGGTLGGVLGSDAVGFSMSASFADKNVGTGKPVSIAGFALTGADAGNYAIGPLPVLSASITPASVTIAGLRANNKVYDATTAATLSDGALTGVLGSDSVAITTGSASFADPNAGRAKPVTVQGIALTGADAGNYTLQPVGALSADITPAPLTIQANNLSKEEGQALTFAGTEFTPARTGIGNETITFVSLSSEGAAASAKAGAYPINPSGASGSNGFNASNYAITYLDGALAVVPALLTQQLPAVVQVNNQVVTFATLFIEEAVRQATSQLDTQDYLDAKKKRDQGQDDVIVTNNVCK